MFYEIDSEGKKIRHLQGYFNGFKDDLANIDQSLLSDTQKDYMNIPANSIIEVSADDHLLYQSQKAIKDKRIAEIKSEMDLLDKKSIRPMRDGETERLLEINNQISVLRNELQELEE
jgi:hypothetical protein